MIKSLCTSPMMSVVKKRPHPNGNDEHRDFIVRELERRIRRRRLMDRERMLEQLKIEVFRMKLLDSKS